MSDRWKTGAKWPANTGAYADAWNRLEGQYLPDGILDEIVVQVDRSAGTSSSKDVAGEFFNNGEAVPLPNGTKNNIKPTDPTEPIPSAPILAETAKKLPKDVEDDTVIVGIVDTGIALGHRRFRDKKGNTRFLAAWQQSAQFQGQKDLPSGREVYASEINDALRNHSGENLNGYLDEDAFNRDLGLVDLENPLGNRDLELSAAHGTHVLDLATGLDPDTADPNVMRRQRIVAVNLPAQYSHGSAGNFLAYFAVYAVERILHIADAQWHQRHSTPDAKTVMGYPIVINFSYGMHAGPKDGNHIFEKALHDVVENRKKAAVVKGWQAASPVRIAMPAGNDNLLRGAASKKLKPTRKKGDDRDMLELPWRIQPSDSTANFLEIWTEAKESSEFSDVVAGLEVFVTPQGAETGCRLATLAHAKVQTLGSDSYARAYVRHQSGVIETKAGKKGIERTKQKDIVEGLVKYRLGILIAVAPTTTDLPGAPMAPAGEWNIRLVHKGLHKMKSLTVSLYIQSDQSAVRVSKTALRSYFDHENYQVVLENGAVADNYSIEPEAKDEHDFVNHDYWPLYGPVRRKGTHNAISSLDMEELVVIGGYNDETGYPASYSSSADGDPSKTAKGRTIVTVSYPSESGGQFGLLAAGARDGSVTAYRGTSMATALATRDIAAAFLKSGNDDYVGTERWMMAQSDKFKLELNTSNWGRWGEQKAWPPLPKIEGRLKMGVGPMPRPDLSRQWSRLGRD